MTQRHVQLSLPVPQVITPISLLTILEAVEAHGPDAYSCCPIFSETKFCNFVADGGLIGPTKAPRGPNFASTCSHGFSYALAVGSNRKTSPSGEETTNIAVSDIWGGVGRRLRAALDCRPLLRIKWNYHVRRTKCEQKGT